VGKAAPLPIINDGKGRVAAIRDDRPAVFEIADDSKETGEKPALYEFAQFGADAVARHDKIIESESKRRNVDTDLVRAIMYVENARGWYDFIDPEPATIRPMNIDPELWRGLGGIDPDNATDPRTNIRAGTVLIGRLSKRISGPSPRKMAALWNSIAVERTGNRDVEAFAARVAYVYRNKLWEKAHMPTADPNLAP